MGVRYAKMIKTSSRYVKKKSYKNFDEVKFLERIKNTSWWYIYQSYDVNEAVHLFTNEVTSILDQMAPVRAFQTSSKYCPWLTEKIKEMIGEKNKAQELLSENTNNENYTNLKS